MVDQMNTGAISQMLNHVQLHIHWMQLHVLNTWICMYTYATATVTNFDQDRYVMKLFNLEIDCTVFKLGVFLTKFEHNVLLFLSAQPDYV